MRKAQLSYTNRDYESIKRSLIHNISEVAENWTDYNDSDFGIALVELFCGIGDMLSFYIDRRANDLFIDRLRSRRSLISLLKLIDYRPRRIMAAETVLRFSVEKPVDFNITIPQYTECQTSGGLKFVTRNSAILYAGQKYVDVPAVQAELITETFQGTGEPRQAFRLVKKDVAENLLDVYVSGTLWKEDKGGVVNPEDDRVYRVETDHLDNTSVIFSARRGVVPTEGQPITVIYGLTKGPEGNLSSEGQITEITGVFPHRELLSVRNIEPAIGGAPRESIETAREEGPLSVRTLHRAVTFEDYEHLARMVPGVAKARAENGKVKWRSINLYVAPVGGGMPPPSLKKELEEYFRIRMDPINDLFILDPAYPGVLLEATVHVKDNYPQSEAEGAFRTALEEYFSFENQQFEGGTSLGPSAERGVYLSEIYRIAAEIESIRFVEVTLLAREDEGINRTVLNFAKNEIPQLAAGHPVLTMVGGV